MPTDLSFLQPIAIAWSLIAVVFLVYGITRDARKGSKS